MDQCLIAGERKNYNPCLINISFNTNNHLSFTFNINMTDNQRKIFKLLRWVFYSLALLLIIDFVPKFLSPSLAETNSEAGQILKWIERAVFFVVFMMASFAVIALIQHFFTKDIEKNKTKHEAAESKQLLRIDVRFQFVMAVITLVIVVGFVILLNILVFRPEAILDREHLGDVPFFAKIIVGLLYIVAHFLLIVFGARLIKGMPPLFLATEKGFCYNPAGISMGWILWDDITEARETTIIYGNSVTVSPSIRPVLGLKLINPENYNDQAYAPLLKKMVDAAQQLNNFQTEGVGDVLLLPEDFGKDYEKVKTLFKEKTKPNVWQESIEQK
jgi:hypothetical protein